MNTEQEDFATVDELPTLGLRVPHFSTLKEYFEAGANRANNAAGQNIDAGREPYLLSKENLELSLHPYFAIYDVMRETRAGLVGVDLHGGACWLPANTAVVWR